MTPPATPFQPGETLGRYRLDAVLGTGGFGAVYRATLDGPMSFRKTVAIKRIHPHLVAGDPRFGAALVDEARLGGLLRHDNIVETYELAQDAGTWFVVMEYVGGATLEQVLARCRATGTRLPPALAAEAGEQVCRGLHHAHRLRDEAGNPLGIVHRDLKPANLMLTATGVVKVMDFGIAKAKSRLHETTRTGQAKGTPAYMSPEQVEGRRDVGPASDLFAVGAILYEMLAGERLFPEDNPWSVLYAVVHEDRRLAARAVDPLLPGIGEVVARCLARDPAERWAAGELGQALRGLRGGAADLLPVVAPLLLAREGDTAFRSRPGPGVPRTVAGFVESFLDEDAGEWPPPAPPTAPTGDLGPSAAAPGGTAAAWLETSRTPENTPPTAAAPPRGTLPALALLLAVAVAAWWWSARPPDTPAAPAPSPPFTGIVEGLGPCPEGASPPLLRRTGAIDLPPDPRRVLVSWDDTLVVEGNGAWYLVPVEGTGETTRVPLVPGERLLGAGEDGALWLARGSDLVRRRPVQGGDDERVAALPPSPEGEARIAVTATGRHLAVAGDLSIAVHAVEAGAATPAFEVDWQPGPGRAFALTDRFLVAALAGGTVAAWSVPDGRPVARWEGGDEQVRVLTVQDETGRVATGGWFDHVDVLRIDPVEREHRLSLRGQTWQVAWLPDHPTLLVAGEEGLTAWRPGEGVVARQGAAVQDVHATGGRIAAVRERDHRLDLLSWQGAGCLRVAPASPRGLWTVRADRASGQVFAGGQDGALWRVSLGGDGKAQRIDLHSDGLTSLASDGAHLASASDDRTIAVWRLPEVALEWRSKGHGYLVNQLFLRADRSRLWSSSSDGTIKAWSWPALEVLEELSTQELLGERLSLAAIWASAEGDRVVAGTWRHALVDFRRQPGGGWDAVRLPVDSTATYDIAGLEAARAVLVVGLYPPRVLLYDLESGRLHELKHLGLRLGGARLDSAGTGAWVVGEGAVLHYAVEREAGGALRYEVRAALHGGMNMATAVDVLEEPDRLVISDHRGRIMVLDAEEMDGPVIWEGGVE